MEKDIILGIIQARFASTRLPGKVLMPLAGKKVLEHVIARVKASKLISDVIVATTTKDEDDAIEAFCRSIGAKVFRGSENDVLDRFYRAAKTIHPDHVARMTADCPLMDPMVIDKIISTHLESGSDYCSNTLKPTYPDGEDIEVFKMSVLEDAWKHADLSSEREHVTSYIYKDPHKFKLVNVSYSSDISNKRWTLDRKEDYKFLKKIYDQLGRRKEIFGMDDVLAFLKGHDHLESLNSSIVRNEGYVKSLKEDKVLKPKS